MRPGAECGADRREDLGEEIIAAAEFLIAGASAVEVGTASFWDPASLPRIVRELKGFVEAQNIASVRDLIGTLVLGD